VVVPVQSGGRPASTKRANAPTSSPPSPVAVPSSSAIHTTPSASACAARPPASRYKNPPARAAVPASPSLRCGDPAPEDESGTEPAAFAGEIGYGGRGRGCGRRGADQVASGGAVGGGRVGLGGLVLRPHAPGARAGPAVGHAPGARRDDGHPQVPGPSPRASSLPSPRCFRLILPMDELTAFAAALLF